jgi:hypothetical protein
MVAWWTKTSGSVTGLPKKSLKARIRIHRWMGVPLLLGLRQICFALVGDNYKIFADICNHGQFMGTCGLSRRLFGPKMEAVSLSRTLGGLFVSALPQIER